MTPTFASRQSTTPVHTPDHKDVSSTPIVPKSPIPKGKDFLSRVGLRRTAGTPNFKKDAGKGISFPDKVNIYDSLHFLE